MKRQVVKYHVFNITYVIIIFLLYMGFMLFMDGKVFTAGTIQ